LLFLLASKSLSTDNSRLFAVHPVMTPTAHPSLLTRIESPADVRAMDETERAALADEARRFLIESVSKSGGHLAANLGAVELTIALHYVFDGTRATCTKSLPAGATRWIACG
jgi:hypothetical protein